jgi:segregation and condensation protein B
MSTKRTRRKREEAPENSAAAPQDGAGETFAGGEVGRLEAELEALAEAGISAPDESAGVSLADEIGAPDGGREAFDEDAGREGVDDEGADEDASAEDEDAEGEDVEDDDRREVRIFDADAEDRAEELARRAAELKAAGGDTEEAPSDDSVAPGGQPRELAELMSICEALIFVSEEPLPVKALADVLGEEKSWVQVAVEGLAEEFNNRNGGLMLREVAGGWQIATRPEHHEHVRAYLKSRPSAKLSLAALETLAVIAYKQPITVPEILEIRGVQSSSAIKTLLDKRLIVARGRKETVGRPMMYGTSKDFLMQFGLRDLGELPSIEDFEDLAAGEA